MATATLEAVTLEAATITGEELFALGDIGPAELINGRIIPMSPTGGEHGRVETELAARLREFARQQNSDGWLPAKQAFSRDATRIACAAWTWRLSPMCGCRGCRQAF